MYLLFSNANNAIEMPNKLVEYVISTNKLTWNPVIRLDRYYQITSQWSVHNVFKFQD